MKHVAIQSSYQMFYTLSAKWDSRTNNLILNADSIIGAIHFCELIYIYNLQYITIHLQSLCHCFINSIALQLSRHEATYDHIKTKFV